MESKLQVVATLMMKETMASSIQFKEFDNRVEPRNQYVERLGHMLDAYANDITEEGKKRSHLLSLGLVRLHSHY